MKKLVPFLSFLLLISSLQAQKFTILHTNDMHSRLIGYAPSGEYTPETLHDDETVGGFARIAGYFKQVEGELGEKPFILDGGDFLMGTLFHTLEPKEGFQLRLMNFMGYDVVAIGNHEFDLGIQKLGEIIVRADLGGNIPDLVLSNIQFHPEESEDNLLEELFQKGTIKPAVVKEYKGLKIGLFGIMGDEAAQVAPYVKPAQFTNRIEKAREMAKWLKEDQKVDIVICLSHSGVIKDKKDRWAGEDLDLASEVPDIDLIISGHSHTHLFEPIMVNGTPIVQAGSEGRFVGRLDLEWKDGQLLVLHDELKVMDDQIQGDMAVQRQILEYQNMVVSTVFAQLNLDAEKPICETGFDLKLSEFDNLETSNLGPLVSNAIHWYASSARKSDLTLAVAGLIRDNIISGKSGQQSANDLFRIVPLGSGVYDDSPGYSLAQVFVTAKEIKSILEAMRIAPKISTSNFPYWTGVRYKYNPNRLLMDQVYDIELGSDQEGWIPLDMSAKNDQLYAITTNNYVLEFFGMISEVTFGILKVVPKDAAGNPVSDLNTLVVDGHPDQPGLQEIKEWEAIMKFAAQFSDTNGNGIPDIPDYYREAHLAGEKDASLSPVKLLKDTNGVQLGVTLVGVAVLAGTGLIILL